MNWAAAWKRSARRNRHLYDRHMKRCDSKIIYGIVRLGHHLGYGWGSGALRWLPRPIQGFIVRAWNHTACALLGHDVYGPWYDDDGKLERTRFCSACSREWPSPPHGEPSWEPLEYKPKDPDA